MGDTARRAPACTNSLPWSLSSASTHQIGWFLLTITLWGGHGRSLKLKLFVAKSPSLLSPRGPLIVASSPGAKAIMVEDMMMPPHESVALNP